MISRNDLDRLSGQDVIGTDGERFGTVDTPYVAYDKDRVKGAPRIDDEHLSPEVDQSPGRARRPEAGPGPSTRGRVRETRT